MLTGIRNLTVPQVIMIAVGLVLIYLAAGKGFEPLLLLPIGFGAVLVNIPLAGLMDEHGVLRVFYNAGVANEIFPILIFIGIGAMIDFTPLLENPRILLLGAAGQFGIFLTLLVALALGFTKLEATTIGIIGAADGPTTIYFASKFAPHMLGAVSVAAYSYMSLVPLIQPPIMRLLTTQKEREIMMPAIKRTTSKRVKILFPIVVTLITSIIAPLGTPLIGMLMLGNFMRESGAVERLSNMAQNELCNIVTLLLGISIGATMQAEYFLRPQTLLIFALGLVAICLDTATGVVFGKIMCFATRGKVNPLIGAAGISAFPMSARVVQSVGMKANPRNHLLMHAAGANMGGQIGSVMAAAVLLSIITGLGLS
ncbi:MAG: sodium ion-translocating decarboxylase subunit beta [Chloroflexi bacterium]|nr:sodium ion-translocating decarboxylase subunit beta [Chloroflexota bacterium]